MRFRPVSRAFVAATVTSVVISTLAVILMVLPRVSSGDTTSSGAPSTTGRTDRSTPPSTPPRPAPEAIRYVALGSSYAAGPDSHGIVDEKCLRTANDYPHQVAAAWRMDLTDVTCSGSTIDNILSMPQRNRAQAPQIEAVTADTDLVTITTGGNDVNYIGRLTSASCLNVLQTDASQILSQRCRPQTNLPDATDPATQLDYRELERGLVQVVAAVKARAPKAVVMIVDYLPVVDVSRTCASVPLTREQLVQTVQTYNALIGATRAAAAASGALLVDASAQGANHTACSAEPWVYGYRRPAPYHPNRAGRQAMAGMVIDALRQTSLQEPPIPS
ncbi:SGNH/GDSL hydrolase family protein [Williamsia sp. CHRR-6]|uniref:SGNH/GDSL hydrolase family protein n=1 Tax=Williamsia sp. CHRR-6 TaxID=2835871 RepID=UPI001BD9F886|nr:SGNH/GDSL hydrolase family protein [Williamsia sp. CHRR-6]MBT0568525.1 SGNH/GDSL hydrolase family protein [Williamsia sp. CHRR-6]